MCSLMEEESGFLPLGSEGGGISEIKDAATAAVRRKQANSVEKVKEAACLLSASFT